MNITGDEYFNRELKVYGDREKSMKELEQKSLEILKYLAEMCERGEQITIASDWGYGSGTLIAENLSHTHFGGDWGDDREEQLKLFINGLHGQLISGHGLSWAPGGKETT